MPEGDSIRKLADYLGPELCGQSILEGWVGATPPVDISGSRVSAVYSLGKHLFIELQNNRLLRCHLGMWGTWHGYAPGEPWQKKRRQASIILHTARRVFVCFNANQVELMKTAGVRRRVMEAALGPDLLGRRVDYAAIQRRARDLIDVHTPILDVLLNQRVACGIGNVYKSEVLFLERTNPKTPLSQLTDPDISRIYQRAGELLRSNIRGGARITRHENDAAGRLWVYGRGGRPCLRCDDATIQAARLGRHQRSSYWCPNCQSRRP